ncbi:hypothetical protein BLNAU_8016 [Blattamonas nauphoetae]|uniref:Uncharacterized protein n=1 Tax=Blattamonas nauphoetae TaxID=2049346 RepID=A0ABQ9XZP1_9EUKA|nr:hypothetical protein BLNAU_8016 [Blattamonas nauphoetae]
MNLRSGAVSNSRHVSNSSSFQNTILVNKTSIHPDIDREKAKQTNLVEAFLRQICGKCKSLRPKMLKDLLILATESDWALSAILEVEYITPLEEYCEKTQPCEVPLALPKLLSLIGKPSEAECLLICESTIPSFLLKCVLSSKNNIVRTAIGECLLTMTSTPRSSSAFLAHHKTQFLAFLDHCETHALSDPLLTILAQLCFSPHLEVSKLTLKALSTRCKSDSQTYSFLRTLKVPSGSTDSSSELVPFAGRLCSTLSWHVSEVKSLFTESSPSDGTVSALSTTLPSESPPLNGNTLLDVLFEGFSLLYSLLFTIDSTFDCILIKYDFVPVLKSAIIACLDLLDHERSESNHPPAGRTAQLINVLNISWNCAAESLTSYHTFFYPVVKSAFSDVPQLCSLLERTCCHSSPSHSYHLRMIINVSGSLVHVIPRMLEEHLIQRVIIASNPITVPTAHDNFHLRLIWAISNLILDSKNIAQNKEDKKRIRKLQFEFVLKPAKQYLQFILQREEFIPKTDSINRDLPCQISNLLRKTLLLERGMLEDGEIVETGREEWEVGWLVETTDEDELGERLDWTRDDDARMKTSEKARWKKRVERQRGAGHEDAMEGWMMRQDTRPRSEIAEYVRHFQKESGMNNIIWSRWRYYGY